MDTRTFVTVTTQPMNGRPTEFQVVVGDKAQAHVLRKFNVTADAKVDATKVLCAALIQQMYDLQLSVYSVDADNRNAERVAKMRATEKAIELVEQAQMQLVKANFVEA